MNLFKYYDCLNSKYISIIIPLLLLSVVQQQLPVFCNTIGDLVNHNRNQNPLLSYSSTTKATKLNYQLTLDTNSAELLINETLMLDLILYQLDNSKENKVVEGSVRKREESKKSIQIKLNCDPDKNDEIDWNNKESNCSILKLLEGYDFFFQLQQEKEVPEPELENKSISLTLHALVPGKQQLVAHARWFESKSFIKNSLGRSTSNEEIE